MADPTIIEHLETKSSEKNFAKLVGTTLAAAGLEPPDPLGTEPEQIMIRVKSSVPDAHWLKVGEKISADVDHRDVTTGRWTTRISVHFDRSRNIVTECHTRGKQGDYDHDAWANVKAFPNATKATAWWAKLLAKYRVTAASDPVVPTKARAPKATEGKNERALQQQVWANPYDVAALQVLADAWAERGDLRGEYIQLCLLKKPNAEQVARRAALEKSSGKLVGPAREYLTQWEFGGNGLVSYCGTDAERLVNGLEEINWLNPRLSLVFSTQKLGAVQALAKHSLERIHFVHLATKLNDKKLILLAPSLAKVRNLSIMCRGAAADCISPAGLRALGDASEGLEYFGLDYASAGDLPSQSAYVDVLTTHPAFKGLQVVCMNGTEAEMKPLKKLPKLVQTIRIEYQGDISPNTAQHLIDAKAGRKLVRA